MTQPVKFTAPTNGTFKINTGFYKLYKGQEVEFIPGETFVRLTKDETKRDK